MIKKEQVEIDSKTASDIAKCDSTLEELKSRLQEIEKKVNGTEQTG